MLTTDNHGQNTGITGGGTLWKSIDGMHFDLKDARIGFEQIKDYYLDYNPDKTIKIYGNLPELLERPKILILDGRPAYLYGPSGWNYFGGDRTVCHVLKIHLDE